VVRFSAFPMTAMSAMKRDVGDYPPFVFLLCPLWFSFSGFRSALIRANPR